MLAITANLRSHAQRLIIGIAMLCLPHGLAQAGATPNVPTGRWITQQHDAVIQIAPCGNNLCGQIVGIALAHPNDPMPKNWQGAPQCGMTILQTAATNQNGNIAWVGAVLDPRSGAVYHAQIALDAFRHLLLHGYVGLPIFGQTQTWTPYSGRTLADCRLAAAPNATSGNNG